MDTLRYRDSVIQRSCDGPTAAARCLSGAQDSRPSWSWTASAPRDEPERHRDDVRPDDGAHDRLAVPVVLRVVRGIDGGVHVRRGATKSTSCSTPATVTRRSRRLARRNQPFPGPYADRMYTSSPTRTTQMITAGRRCRPGGTTRPAALVGGVDAGRPASSSTHSSWGSPSAGRSGVWDVGTTARPLEEVPAVRGTCMSSHLPGSRRTVDGRRDRPSDPQEASPCTYAHSARGFRSRPSASARWACPRVTAPTRARATT